MTHPLLALPTELLELIAENLDEHALIEFRSACRDLSKKLFKQYCKRCFNEKRIMLSRESLTALRDIARDDTFGPYLETVEIATDHFSPAGLTALAGGEARPASQVLAYKDYLDDQSRLRASGEDAELLCDAFRQLSSLKSLVVGHPPCRATYYPYNFFSAAWQYPSWGTARVLRNTGCKPDSLTPIHTETALDKKNQLEACEHAVSVTLKAVAESGILIHDFQLILGWPMQPTHPSFKHVSPAMRDSLGRNFSELKSLYLCSLHYDYPTIGPDESPSSLSTFCSTMPSLSQLWLVLSPGVIFEDFVTRHRFLHLKRLCLEATKVFSQALLTFIVRHRHTLESLALLQVTLRTSEQWIDILQAVQAFPRLKAVSLSRLSVRPRLDRRAQPMMLLDPSGKSVDAYFEDGDIARGVSDILKLWARWGIR